MLPAPVSGSWPRAAASLLGLLCCALSLVSQVDAAANKTLTDSIAVLKGRTLRCVHTQELSGDGFLRFAPGSEELKAELEALPDWGEKEIPLTSLQGFNIRVLQALREESALLGAPFNISYWYLKVPEAIGGASTPGMAAALERGFDCLLSSVLVKPDRKLFMDFLVPHMPYGYQVLAPKPIVAEPSTSDKMVTFLKPFSTGLWCMIIAFLLFSGLVLYLVESHAPGSEFYRSKDLDHMMEVAYSSKLHEEADKLGLSVYRSIAVTTTGEEGSTPVTAAGRVYFIALSLFAVIVVAAYTANLAVFLFQANTPVAQIQSIDDFVRYNRPACIRSTSKAPLDFMRQNYPRVPLVVVEGTEPQIAAAVQEGRCAGGVSTDVHLRHLLATQQSTCSLQLVGSTLSFGYYAIPWRYYEDPVLAATSFGMSILLIQLIEQQRLIEYSQEDFPVKSNLDCSSFDQTEQTTQELSLQDMAGVFVLMGIFTCATFLLAGWRYWRARRVARRMQVPLHRVFTAARKLDDQESGLSNMRLRGGGGGGGGGGMRQYESAPVMRLDTAATGLQLDKGCSSKDSGSSALRSSGDTDGSDGEGRGTRFNRVITFLGSDNETRTHAA